MITNRTNNARDPSTPETNTANMDAMIRAALIALTLIAATACGTIRFVEDTYAEASPAELAGRVTLVNDPVEGRRTASMGPNRRSPPIEPYVFAIERQGVVTVTLQVRTTAGQWVYPQAIFFGEPSRSGALTFIDSDVHCSTSGACSHIERAAIKLTNADVSALLADDQPQRIPLRVVGRTGLRIDGYIRRDEIAETLRALGALESFR